MRGADVEPMVIGGARGSNEACSSVALPVPLGVPSRESHLDRQDGKIKESTLGNKQNELQNDGDISLNVSSANAIKNGDVIQEPMVVENLEYAATIPATEVESVAIGVDGARDSSEACSSGALPAVALDVPSKEGHIDQQHGKMKEGTPRDKQNERRRRWYAKLLGERKNARRQRQREYAKTRYAQRMSELSIEGNDLRRDPQLADVHTNVTLTNAACGVGSDLEAPTVLAGNAGINLDSLNVSAINNDDPVHDAIGMENLEHAATVPAARVEPMVIDVESARESNEKCSGGLPATGPLEMPCERDHPDLQHRNYRMLCVAGIIVCHRNMHQGNKEGVQVQGSIGK